MGDFYSLALLLCRAAACVLSRVVIHQTAITAWRTTAGHNATPYNPKAIPAKARTAVAGMLYISIATTNPLAARLCVSSRASQQATPSASNAAPATRPSITAADVSSGEPSSNRATTEGTAINPSPVAASIMAVSLSKRLIAFEAPREYVVGGVVSC